MNDRIVQRVGAVFVLILAILMAVAIVAVRNIRRSVAASDWVNHTHAIILEVNSVLSSLHEGDAALRTYLVSGDARDQNAYREAYTEMIEHLAVATALTRSDAARSQQVAALEGEIARRIDLTREIARSRQDEGIEGARRALNTELGSQTLGAIKRQVAKLNQEVKALLQQRDRDAYVQAQTTRWTVLSGIGLNFLLLGFAGWLIRDDIAARRRAASALEDANAQLEVKVQERTHELAAANETLKAENLERQWSNQALEHQLRYSQLIINSIHDLVFVLTKALNISRINPAVVHSTQYDSTELVTSPLAGVVELIPDGPGYRPDMLTQALKDGRDIQDYPVNLVTKTGEHLPFRLNLFPLRDRDKVVGGVATLRRVSTGEPPAS